MGPLAAFQAITRLQFQDPDSTALMHLRELSDGLPQGAYLLQWCNFNEISPVLSCAVVCAEDPKFFTHHGFDWAAMRSAVGRFVRQRKITSGGSTISQQLAKNLYLTMDRTIGRKLHEAVLTYLIEGLLTKQRILEVYLNVIEWGTRIWGCTSACRYYLDKHPLNVNAFEAGFLASLIPAPRRGCAPERLRWMEVKHIRILSRMCAAGIIDEQTWMSSCVASAVLYQSLKNGAELVSLLRYISSHPPAIPVWANSLLSRAKQLVDDFRRDWAFQSLVQSLR